MRDPFAVACKARDRLGWPEQKALVLVIAAQPDVDPVAAWAGASTLCDLFGIPEDVQATLHAEAQEHRGFYQGHAAPPR